MAYVPRHTILARMEDEYGIRLIAVEVIHDADLRAIWDALMNQESIITQLAEGLDVLGERIGELEMDACDIEEGRA